jgi:hypothetical protein
MGDPHLVTQWVNQSDLLGHSYVWQVQFQVSDLHFQTLSSRLGTTDILSDPAFVVQPNDSFQPGQLALQWNLINQTWPTIGGMVLQTMLQGGLQWTDNAGSAVTLQPGIDISNTHLDWFHLQVGVQFSFSEGADGALRVQTQLPVSTVMTGVFRF